MADTPNSESVAPDISSNIHNALDTYTKFLAGQGMVHSTDSVYKVAAKSTFRNMAAIWDSSNPASPLAYGASKTALLLMDFQGLIITRCGQGGDTALRQAKVMRDWAFSRRVMVVHSIVDVQGTPPPTCKGAERVAKMLASVADDREAAEEPTEIAFSKANNEYVVLKHPGFVSALKSTGIMKKFNENGVKSLILCGLSTSGAVLRTAMAASDEGFVVSVIEDACTDPVEGLHDTVVKHILPSRAHVATAEQFMEQWPMETKD